jgi:hypothetical protein
VKQNFARAFVNTLGERRDAEYADISAAVRAAAEKTVPLMRPTQRTLPVWQSDPTIMQARLGIERLRRSRQPTNDAEEAFARLLDERQQAAVDDAVRSITGAGPDVRPRAVWTAVRTLTGRKRRVALNLAGDTPEERRNELRDFFAGIVNAPTPPPPADLALPQDTPLPAEEVFSTSPVTTDDVVQFARRTPGGRALGPDEVPVEALRVRCVAVQVARVMNRMLAGDLAPSEWTFAHIVPIPKKPGTTRK